MNDQKENIAHTGLYTDLACQIIDSVLGQWSDGWGENSPRYESYWQFCQVTRDPFGEVIIKVSAEPTRFIGCTWKRCKYLKNAFYGASERDVLDKFAKDLKKTVQMFIKDNKCGKWDRNCTTECTYIHTHSNNVPISQCYFVYDHLIGPREVSAKYDDFINMRTNIVGRKMTEEQRQKEIEKRAEITAAYKEMEKTFDIMKRELKETIANLEKETTMKIQGMYTDFRLKYGENFKKYVD